MKKHVKEQLKEFGEDLLSLEINTIVKDNITGRKMSGARLALIQIAKKYNVKLLQIDPELALAEGTLFGSPGSFREIQKSSDKKLGELKKLKCDEDNADLWMLYRIKNTSRTILNIFDGLKPWLLEKIKEDKNFWDEAQHILDNKSRLPFTANELSIIRKAWELGIEDIAIQTVVQLDGDVVTRIQPQYAKEINSGLRDVHNQGITTSIKFWKTLVELVQDFIKSIWKFVFPAR